MPTFTAAALTDVPALLLISSEFGKALEGCADRAKRLEIALQDALLFAEWVECIGKPDVEVYKHELRASAELAIDRINSALDA